MKTREFIEKVVKLGYSIVEEDYGCKRLLISTSGGLTVINAWTSRENTLSVQSSNIDLIKLCIEYAETPLSEREEVKKYTVVLPDDESRCESARIVLAKTEDGRVILNTTKKGNVERLTRYHLTEAEIKRNHSYLWQFREEVEE